jgi:hypothetical protein
MVVFISAYSTAAVLSSQIPPTKQLMVQTNRWRSAAGDAVLIIHQPRGEIKPRSATCT